MSSISEATSSGERLARFLGVLLAISTLGTGLTSRAKADSITYTASVDSPGGGLFPLFSGDLGTLTRVDVSASLSGGQSFYNESGNDQSGTWSAGLDVVAVGVGEIAGGTSSGTYSAGPGEDFFLYAEVTSSDSFTSGLDGFYISPAGDSGAGMFAGFFGGLSAGFVPDGLSSAAADLTVTYTYYPLGGPGPGAVPEPSGFVLGAISLVGMAVSARCRAWKKRRPVN